VGTCGGTIFAVAIVGLFGAVVVVFCNYCVYWRIIVCSI
jgi:hypothetical protein